jgi:magnesium transporter
MTRDYRPVWRLRSDPFVGDDRARRAATHLRLRSDRFPIGRERLGLASGSRAHEASLTMPTLPLPRPRLRRPAGNGPALPVDGPETSTREEVAATGIRWIHVEQPRSIDSEWLLSEFGFHPLDIEDVFSRNQRPKLDVYDDYLFIVLHFPVFDKLTGRLLTAEVDVFVGEGFLITLSEQALPPLSALFERHRESEELREQAFSKGSGYLLYRIVDRCVDASFPMLRKMGAKLDRLEDEIIEGRSEAIVRDLSDAKQEIINFRRIVRPMRAVLRDLERTKQRYLAEELEIYFDDISDAEERIWDLLENYKEVIEALESTNESAISHRLNETFRILTAVSVIILPLTLIASIFGMNVLFPGEGSVEAFWLVLGAMIVVLVSLTVFFRRRGWL